jgi:hypothetical protein
MAAAVMWHVSNGMSACGIVSMWQHGACQRRNIITAQHVACGNVTDMAVMACQHVTSTACNERGVMKREWLSKHNGM